jgi:hypothetical protein
VIFVECPILIETSGFERRARLWIDVKFTRARDAVLGALRMTGTDRRSEIFVSIRCPWSKIQ